MNNSPKIYVNLLPGYSSNNERTPYNFRNFQSLYSDNKKIVNFGAETITWTGNYYKDKQFYSKKHKKNASFVTHLNNKIETGMLPCIYFGFAKHILSVQVLSE